MTAMDNHSEPWVPCMSEEGKRAAGVAACDFVRDGMRVGLGTGSTVRHTVIELGRLVAEGLAIEGIPTSEETARLAREVGVPLVQWGDVNRLDLVIDGADEVDLGFQLIKGGGGALTREKIVASVSDAMVVVVDPRKDVETLGSFALPIEVLPFGWNATLAAVRSLCPGEVTMRRVLGKAPATLDGETVAATAEGGPFVTDNGNLVFDASFGATIVDPINLESNILSIPGIVEVGLFCGMCDVVVIGSSQGVEIRRRPNGRLG